MKSRGLTVVEVPPERLGEWRRAADDFTRGAREGLAPPEILQAVRDEIAAARAAGAKP